MNLAVGIDIGATKIKLGLIDIDGSICLSKKIATNSFEKPGSIIERLISEVKELCQSKLPTSIGIGVAGQIDPVTGMVLNAPNLGWKYMPLKDRLKEVFPIPIEVVGDVKAATIGEWQFGAGKGSQNFVCVFFGTGIGTGIILNNKLVLGPNNTAGEMGHMIIDMDGPECSCGSRGCWEVHGAGWALAKKARMAVLANPKEGTNILELCNHQVDQINAKMITALALEGDALSQKLVDEVKNAMSLGCVNIVNTLDPSRLIIGGGMSEGIPDLTDYIRKVIQQRALRAACVDLQVLPAKLGSNAAMIGASFLSRF